MRLLLIVLLFCSITASATVYQVGTGGNLLESNIASTTFQPADQLLFKCGEKFSTPITINQSGTSENPIVIGKWGIGVNPIISGFTTVTSWTNLGSNIWESTSAVSALDSCNMVTIEGINTQMGRYPNSTDANGGYLNIDSKADNYNYTISELTGINWTGAVVVFRQVYSIVKRNIINHVGTTITTNDTGGYLNYGMFIQDDARTLDQQNEWYFNHSTKKIKIYSTSQPTSVKVASVNTLLSINGSYVTIDGINFEGANKYAIFRSTHSTVLNHIIVKNCNISFSGIDGIAVRYDYLTVDNNTITDSNSNAIDVSYSNYVTITNNHIQNTALLNGMGHPEVGTQAAIMARPSNNITFEYNEILNTGLNGIYFYGDNVLVKNNFINTYCVTLDDGGGIYTYTGTGGTMTTNGKIQGNICINGIGQVNGTNLANPDPDGRPAFGIYLDEQAKNIDVFDNTVAYNSSAGILLNASAGYINVHRNTSFDNAGRQFHSTCYDLALKPTNNRVFSNLFFSTKATQKCLYFYGHNVLDVTALDSNYYARPIDDFGTPSLYDKPIFYSGADYNSAFRTLTEWQTFSGQDVHSTKSPQAITSESDLQFEYNATSVAIPVTLSQSMIDVKGTKYSGTINIQPYSSLLLMKQNISSVKVFAPNKKYWKF